MMEQHGRHGWKDRYPIAKSEIDEALDRPSAMLPWLLPAMLIWVLAVLAACLYF